MKAFAFVALLTLFGAADATRASLSPVTRVVELLKDLSAKVEKDNKAEEDLYETFVCWAKSMVSQKTASNSAAESRIDMLATYISDLDSGRIELTSERKDLEKEIATLTTDIETSTNERNKEHKDFLDAEEEMEMALSALDEALDVLRTATEGHEKGVLMSLKGMMSEGATERTRQATQLHKAVDLASKVLKKGDAIFLRRVLTGETPTPDWKKLNRKATFKMSYKKRSGKIQELLAKMESDFKANLAAAQKTEEEAVSSYEKLKGSKTDELETAQGALNDMAAENGAKGMSKEKAQEEVDALKAQVANDEKYIEQVSAELAAKKEEWKDRQALRAGELAAISKAIEILSNDDARDLMKKSFSSHDKSLLQLGSSSASALMLQRGSNAAAALLAAGKQASDARLSLLASRLSSGSHFDDVISAIDKMVGTLEAEEASDLEKKETCEADRAADTKDAQVNSRSFDEAHDEMVRLTGEIADLSAAVKEKQEQIAEIVKELAEAKEIREKENAEYLESKADDKEASATVLRSKAVLEKFYQENDLVFMQGKKQPFNSAKGEAPPPPPPTWEAPYGGATGESQGIIAILTMVNDDILKDIAKADQEETDAADLYGKTKTALTTEKGELEGQINKAETTIAEHEITRGERNDDKKDSKTALELVMKKIADADGFCSYFTINYPLRLKNRQVEMDGLKKAKTILSGGSFTAVDPDREMKPGDAFLQRRA